MSKGKIIVALLLSLFMSVGGVTQTYATTIEIKQSSTIYGTVEYYKDIHGIFIEAKPQKSNTGLNRYNSEVKTDVNLKTSRGYVYNTFKSNVYTNEIGNARISETFPVATVICVNVSGNIGSKKFSFTY